MFYIHQSHCIFSQQLFTAGAEDRLHESVDNKLFAIEPAYEGIPLSQLRRMGKAVRIGTGAAMPLIRQNYFDGIVIGTANGGLEDCIKFLNQVIEFEEGTLTPTNFVQSTANAIASQLAFLSANKGYNITHVHRGLAFENALTDVDMLLREQPGNTYLLGGVDEISTYHYNIDYAAGWFKKEPVRNTELYASHTPGTIAGEGAAMFAVSNEQTNAVAAVKAVQLLHTADPAIVKEKLTRFMQQHAPAGIDLLLSGDSGDMRFSHFSETCEETAAAPVARFKHLTGEFGTASAVALWLACQALRTGQVPAAMMKAGNAPQSIKNILIYNHYHGRQHSFILLSAA